MQEMASGFPILKTFLASMTPDPTPSSNTPPLEIFQPFEDVHEKLYSAN
jgi:hypothetical protein